MTTRISVTVLTLAFAVCFAGTARGDSFSFSTGSPDGKLGALSRPPGQGLETETADDFVLTQATVVSGATIHGLIPTGTALSSVARVEVEIYHIFPLDSDTVRTPSVTTRVNSPSDVEIDAATRDSDDSSLSFIATEISSFAVLNTVINGINKAPGELTHGEGPAAGEQVEIDVTFTTPLFLPAGHYFFRPEVRVDGGSFLFLSAPRPITSGTPFPAGTTDLQAWIRNANLVPDWLRIGTDIIGAGTFNMTFSLGGNTIPEAGRPGQANCHGRTVSAMAEEFGGIDASALTLGYSSVSALQDGIRVFCER
ncbi:MAG TPA: PEP-CTERM sorting domain-containing protein [Nitrospirota bacterium]